MWLTQYQMDIQLKINEHAKRKTHFFKLFISCAIGGVFGHVSLLLIVILEPTLILDSTGLVINEDSLKWSALFYSLVLLGLKLLGDCYLFLTKPKIVDDTQVIGEASSSQVDGALRRIELQNTERLWKGFRPFIVDRKEFETLDKSVCSFYLKPYDQQWVPLFSPGQYLTFRLDHIEGQSKSIVRCYSLSDEVNKDYYRVSIKRVPAPPKKPDLLPGLSSNYFHDYVKVGDVLDVKAPSGHFYLNHDSKSGVVLIAGGVGFTPMISILNTLLTAKSKRDIWFFYGATNSDQHAMKEYLENIVENHKHVHLINCYSKPLDIDEEGVDYQVEGRVSVKVMKQYLPANNFEYYICGPGPLMVDVTEGLREWGVPDKDVYFEAFGPASVPKSKTKKVSSGPVEVRFEQSDENIQWNSDDEVSLLESALAATIDISSSCRMGNCGSCETALLKGKVEYPLGAPGFAVAANKCLPCVCVPVSDIVLDV